MHDQQQHCVRDAFENVFILLHTSSYGGWACVNWSWWCGTWTKIALHLTHGALNTRTHLRGGNHWTRSSNRCFFVYQPPPMYRAHAICPAYMCDCGASVCVTTTHNPPTPSTLLLIFNYTSAHHIAHTFAFLELLYTGPHNTHISAENSHMPHTFRCIDSALLHMLRIHPPHPRITILRILFGIVMLWRRPSDFCKNK